MKDWIKHLDDNEITRILGYKNLKREVPAWVDELIINRMKEKQRQETKKSPYAIRSLFAAAILILLVIPVFFIINNFQNNEQLILVRMSNDVTFQQNENIILLQPGDSPDKNSSIITGVDSDCILHYSDKITITIHEKAEVKISENNKKRITFHLAVGEITIKEEKVKGLRIGVKTPVASIYAIGTYYSVTHNVKKEETKIKTYDGTLHIETIPAGEKIILQQGREVIIKKDELPGIHEILLSDKDYEVKWTVRPLYSNPKIREPITGFAVFDNKIIASTNYSIVCMTHGELLWERFPERRLFNAKPVVYNQTVYIPTPDSIVSFDLQTGIPKPEIRVKEGLKPGHTITTYNDSYYINFTSGIYLYNINTGAVEPEPFVSIVAATLPVFNNNMIYVTSYITNEITACDLSGNNVWTVTLNSRSYCSPVVYGNSIIAGTVKGTLYKLSFYGIIENQINLRDSILSILNNDRGFIFILTDKNKLIKIDINTFKIESVYDNVTSAFTADDRIIMGITDGTVKILDIYTNKVNNITLPYSKASSFAYADGIIFTGLKNGYILKIEENKAY